MTDLTVSGELAGRRYFGWSEAERYSGLSIETLKRMAKRGLLHIYRPTPRRVAIDRLELDAAIRRESAVAV
jgi:hypothetical protein